MKCISPVNIKNPRYGFSADETYYIAVPCGKCTACLSNKRREWCFRLENEMNQATSGYFITLTYNDDNCPICVNKKDCQNFLKRFRRRIEPNRVRYFLVSEYGDKFGRPHYHLLLFNYSGSVASLRSDLKSTWLLCDDAWFDRGDTVQRIHPANINYVCKYCLSNIYNDDPLSRTFMLCSRRPGIGHNYLTPDMFRYLRTRADGSTVFHGMPIKLPRFYENKVFPSEYDKEKLHNYRKEHSRDEIERLCRTHGISETQAIRLYEQQLRDFDRRVKQKIKNGQNNVEKHFYNNKRQEAEAQRLQRNALFGNLY